MFDAETYNGQGNLESSATYSVFEATPQALEVFPLVSESLDVLVATKGPEFKLMSVCWVLCIPNPSRTET